MTPKFQGVRVVAFASLFVSGVAVAQTCSPDEARTTFPGAMISIAKWETTRETVVAPTVKANLLGDFCNAGKRLSQDRGISQMTIDNASDNIVFKYLDRTVDPTRAGQSMSAVMRTEFGAGGLSPGDIKRYGRLAITYTLDVDTLRVRGTNFRRVPKVMVEVGKAKVEGLKQKKVLCGGEVDIDSSVEATFKC